MIKAILFDLDGVIVSTDEQHYLAWKEIADQEGIPFDRQTNQALRGVSRMESLEIILLKSRKKYTAMGKLALADKKNELYKKLLDAISPEDILPGLMPLLLFLEENGIKSAIGSSSKNALLILEKIGLQHHFEVIVDGNQITKSKPNPEVFLLAAQKLGVLPRDCLVIEDAISGIDAADAAGMLSVGVGFASSYEKATYRIPGLELFDPQIILKLKDKGYEET